MKLLVLTQKVDRDDTVLGFFHNWLKELSRSCRQLTVICLEEGKHDLPANVRVLSLGKEKGLSRHAYLWRFYRLIWQERNNYDSVLVHMNQEYVLLGGLFWQTLGKRIFLWRNHPKGNFLTTIAVWLADRVFCTSQYSFTAKFKKTKIMPVGIDMDMFLPDPAIVKIPHSILFLGRIAPVKKVDLFIRALAELKASGESFTAHIVGDVLPRDRAYGELLKNMVMELGLTNEVIFKVGVPNYETPKLYSQHELYVNLTPSGSFDKTILEAMACSALIIIRNESLTGQIDDELMTTDSAKDLAQKIKVILNWPTDKKLATARSLQDLVSSRHSLKQLVKSLTAEISSWPPAPKWQIVRYFLAGLVVVVVNLAALYLLTDKLKIWYLLSSVLAFFISFAVSFVVQKFWTFADRRLHLVHVQFFWYLMVTLINLLCNTVLMYCFVSWLGLPYLLSQVLALAIITPPVFLAYRSLVFNRAKN